MSVERRTGCEWAGCSLIATRYCLRGLATEDDFDRLSVVADREDGADLFEELGGEIDVVRLAGLLIVKMGVRAKIRAVAGGAPLEVHRAHEIALHERFEAVVNRREGDGGQSGFYAGEHFVGSGVVAFPEQNIVDDFSLGVERKPLSASFWARASALWVAVDMGFLRRN